MKNLDIKSWGIIALGLALIVMFFVAQKGYLSNYKSDVEKLHLKNKELETANDTLIEANHMLQLNIWALEHQIHDLYIEKHKSDSIITRLKRGRNEIPVKVNNMSATAVSDAFTKYLDKTK